MKKTIIDKITSIGISLALSTSLGLAACSKKPNNYIPMSEIFYDENTVGIDDEFEHRITDSSIQIEKITKLERSIDLLKKIKKIKFEDSDKPEMLSISKDDVDNINLDIVESMYEEYEIMTNGPIKKLDSHKQEQLQKMKIELYKYYIKLNSYINNYGYNTIYTFGMDLYKSIILATTNTNGNETNTSATINNYVGSGSDYKNIAHMRNNGEPKQTEIKRGSKLYDLIGNVSNHEEYKKLKDFHIVIVYDKKKIKEMEDIINFYKECIYTRYEVDNNSFLLFDEPDTIVSKETTVPTKRI